MKFIIAVLILLICIKLFGLFVIIFWIGGGIAILLGIVHVVLKSCGMPKGLFS